MSKVFRAMNGDILLQHFHFTAYKRGTWFWPMQSLMLGFMLVVQFFSLSVLHVSEEQDRTVSKLNISLFNMKKVFLSCGPVSRLLML